MDPSSLHDGGKSIQFKTRCINTRAPNPTVVNAIASDIQQGKIWCFENPMIACVDDGDVEDLGDLAGRDWDATQPLKMIRLCDRARSRGTILLSGNHRLQAVLIAVKALVVLFNKKSAARGKVMRKRDEHNTMLQKLGKKRQRSDQSRKKREEITEIIEELEGNIEDLGTELTVLRDRIHKAATWPIWFYSRRRCCFLCA